MSRAREFADLAGSADAGGLTGRNLIINGAMQVDQRDSATTKKTANEYSVDRFTMSKSGFDQLAYEHGQSTESPDGFSNSFHLKITTAETALAAEELLYWRHKFEGQNLQHLQYGTSNAKTLTISFWIRSSLTGTYSLNLYNGDPSTNRSYLQTYTVDTADTWEYKTLTFEGDTASGNGFNNDNGVSLVVHWTFAAGSNWHGTPHTGWGDYSATDDFASSSNVDFSAQTGDLYITGVQLEVGDKATPFEHRSYGNELAKCQRYYARYASENSYACFGSGFGRSATRAIVYFKYPQEMRARPSVSESNTGVFDNGTVQDITSMQDLESTLSCGSINLNVASGLTATQAAIWIGNNNSSAYVDLDAEL